MILAIDPGKDKCGLAIVEEGGALEDRKVVERNGLSDSVLYFTSQYRISTILVGRGTFSREVEKEISKLDLKANVIFIPEAGSTLEARKRYWKENPPRGWLRFIPTSLRVPPTPVDDYAAVILVERFLSQ